MEGDENYEVRNARTHCTDFRLACDSRRHWPFPEGPLLSCRRRSHPVRSRVQRARVSLHRLGVGDGQDPTFMLADSMLMHRIREHERRVLAVTYKSAKRVKPRRRKSD